MPEFVVEFDSGDPLDMKLPTTVPDYDRVIERAHELAPDSGRVTAILRRLPDGQLRRLWVGFR